MIEPTVGRIVWFHPDGPHEQPLAAIVTFVHSSDRINLAVFEVDGRLIEKSNVSLFQDVVPGKGEFAEWMPYQKGQAAKTEALEVKASAK